MYALLFAEDEEDEEGLGEPLILRIDHDDQGSVGSEDTTGFDSDDDMPPVEAGNKSSHVVCSNDTNNDRNKINDNDQNSNNDYNKTKPITNASNSKQTMYKVSRYN